MRHLFITRVMEVLFIIAIWIPNIAYLAQYSPIVADSAKLVGEIKRQPYAFPDFLKYYTCATLARRGLKEAIWDPLTQRTAIREYLGDKSDSNQDNKPFLQGVGEYTPQFVTCLIPLTYLPFNQALICWTMFSAVFLIASITAFIKRFSRLDSAQISMWWLVLLASGPSWFTFFLGQSAALVTGLFAWFYIAWFSKRDFLAALAIAVIAVIKPHYVLIPVIMALCSKRFRLLLFAFFISLALLCLTAGILEWHTIFNYPSALIRILKDYDSGLLVVPTANATCISLQAPLSYVMELSKARSFLLIINAIEVLAITYVWFKSIKIGQNTYPFALALTILLSFVMGVHALFYDILLLAVPWAMTIEAVQFDKIWVLKERYMKYWCVSFIAFPVINWVILFTKVVDGGPAHLPVLIWLIYLAWRNWQRSIEQTHSTT